jgi:hypothetical protein
MKRSLHIALIILLTALKLGGQNIQSGLAQNKRSQAAIINITATLVTSSPVQLFTLRNMIITGCQGKRRDNEKDFLRYTVMDKERGREREKENKTAGIYISPVTDINAGLLLAKGKPGSRAIIHYKIHEILHENDGEGTISLRYELSTFPLLVQRASKINNSGEIILNFGKDGLFYLWVGGHVNLSNATTGKYTGQFTFEILYI